MVSEMSIECKFVTELKLLIAKYYIVLLVYDNKTSLNCCFFLQKKTTSLYKRLLFGRNEWISKSLQNKHRFSTQSWSIKENDLPDNMLTTLLWFIALLFYWYNKIMKWTHTRLLVLIFSTIQTLQLLIYLYTATKYFRKCGECFMILFRVFLLVFLFESFCHDVLNQSLVTAICINRLTEWIWT